MAASVTGVIMISAAGCSKSENGASKVRIALPAASSGPAEVRSKGVIGTLQVDLSRACFAVNISGPGIASSQPSCFAPIGVFSGFKPAGDVVELTVDRGAGRAVEVFMHLRDDSAAPCPNDVSKVPSESMALIGSQTAIDMNQSLVEVTVVVSAPPAGTNLLSQYSLPASCSAGGNPARPPAAPGTVSIVYGSGRLSGQTYVIHGAVRETSQQNELSGSGYKMTLVPRYE